MMMERNRHTSYYISIRLQLASALKQLTLNKLYRFW